MMVPDNTLDKLHIDLVELIPVKSNPLYRRQKNVTTTPGAIDEMGNILEHAGPRALTPEMLAASASDLITYSANPIEQVEIPYGFESTRLFFTIHVSNDINGSIHRTIIQGYTDRYEVTYNNTLDPDTKFFVNSVVNIVDTRDPMSGAISSNITSAFNVMTDPMTGMTNSQYDFELMSAVHKPMRPEDIQLGLMAKTGSEDNYNIINPEQIDTRATASKLKNNNPLNIVAETLSEQAHALNTMEFVGSDMDLHMTALRTTKEANVDTIPFFRKISRYLYDTRVGQFDFSSLCSVFPMADQNTRLLQSGNPNMPVMDIKGDDLGVVDTDAALANLFLDGCLAYMKQYKLDAVHFTVTNMSQDGSIIQMPLNAPASYLPNVNTIKLYDIFITNVIKFVFPLMSRNIIPIEVSAEINSIIANITIRRDGAQLKMYSIPLMAYSLAAPSIGTEGEYNNMVNAVGNLANLIINVGDNNNEPNRILY